MLFVLSLFEEAFSGLEKIKKRKFISRNSVLIHLKRHSQNSSALVYFNTCCNKMPGTGALFIVLDETDK